MSGGSGAGIVAGLISVVITLINTVYKRISLTLMSQ